MNQPSPITGTEVAYYFICARKLWFFAHNIQCEQESDAVRLGKHIHETSYKREKKEVSIDGVIVVDWMDHEEKIIHEVKKSASMDKAHTWQLKYYMWYLEQKGMHIADEGSMENYPDQPEKRGYIGELNYPKLRQTERIVLSKADREELENKILPNIRKIKNRDKPPKTVEWEICKSCSYNELCYS
ncbi:CRISPR-associated protein Cas4 [Gracilimonas mengyeensis]|uniref:CRISPR-associated exonuclease Cas4 n=1 Tax=Gracilimonas mengyeensis TaxID=1302730 RepID=A0A521CBV1_9BACT|nr:CRISPR-associated protein Cas4 [Gracilimonas mengyeensis]SMO56896.1 CRISPR-associated exonuclease, Cas4 family [Gracilimonas mengyeensis]